MPVNGALHQRRARVAFVSKRGTSQPADACVRAPQDNQRLSEWGTKIADFGAVYGPMAAPFGRAAQAASGRKKGVSCGQALQNVRAQPVQRFVRIVA